VILTLPITILTLGLFLLVINAAMLGLVASFFDGFVISSFWSALLGAMMSASRVGLCRGSSAPVVRLRSWCVVNASEW